MHSFYRTEFKKLLKKGLSTCKELYSIAESWKCRAKDISMEHISLREKYVATKLTRDKELNKLKLEMEEKLRSQRVEYEEHIKKLNEELERIKHNSEKEFVEHDKLKKEYDAKCFHIEKAKGEIIVKEYELQKERLLNNKLKSMNDSLFDELKLKDERIVQLEEKVESLSSVESDYKLCQIDLSRTKDLLTTTEYQIRDMKMQLEDMRKELGKKEDEIIEKSNQINELNSKIENLKDRILVEVKMNEEKESIIINLNNTLKEIENNLSEKDKMLKMKDKEIQEKNLDIECMTSNIENLELQLEEEKAKNNDYEVIQAKNEAVRIYKNIERDLNRRKKALTEENANLRANLLTAENKVLQLENIVRELQWNEQKLIQSLEIARLAHYQLLLQIDTVLTISKLNKSQEYGLPSDYLQFERKTYALLAELEHLYTTNESLIHENENLRYMIAEKDDKLREEARIFMQNIRKLEDQSRKAEEKIANFTFALSYIREVLIKNASNNPIAKEILIQWKSIVC